MCLRFLRLPWSTWLRLAPLRLPLLRVLRLGVARLSLLRLSLLLLLRLPLLFWRLRLLPLPRHALVGLILQCVRGLS